MHESMIKREPLASWNDWLDSAAGRYALGWEKAQFDALVGDVFGYYAVQMGLPQIDALQMNRMPSRILASTDWPGAVADVARLDGSATPPAYTHRLVVDHFEDLPFGDQSIDLLVLPHVLEFADDPHRVLREADRVLRPEGRVVVSGFNPISLWGARQVVPRRLMRPFLPAQASFIGLPRLRDWFKLLSFELDRGHYGCYLPPCRSPIWLDRFSFMEAAGDRWWPICGGVYCISAIKRVRAMRLVGPAWKKRDAPRRRVAVAASQQSTHQRTRQPADLDA